MYNKNLFYCLILILIFYSITYSESALDCLIKNLKNKNSDEKIFAYTKAIEKGGYNNEELAELYLKRGYVYYNFGHGNLEKAELDCKKAIELKSDYIGSYDLLSSIYSWRKNYNKVIEYLTIILKLKDKFSKEYNKKYAKQFYGYDDEKITLGSFYSSRGFYYLFVNNYKNAVKDYTKAIKFKPRFTNYYGFRAKAYLRLKEYDKAISDLSKGIELDRYDYYYLRGDAWFFKKQYLNAIRDYTNAIEAASNESKEYIYLIKRAKTYVLIYRYDKAIEDYVDAIELDDEKYIPYNELAWILATCPNKNFRNGNKALEYALKAYEINDETNILNTLAAAYAENSNFEKAIELQKEAIKNLKDNEKIKDYKTRLELYKKRIPYQEKEE